MGSKLRTLSGKDVVKIFSSFGFSIINQKGSHIKLARTLLGSKEILVVPNHDPIPKGTLKAIFKQSARFISQSELKPFFYS